MLFEGLELAVCNTWRRHVFLVFAVALLLPCRVSSGRLSKREMERDDNHSMREISRQLTSPSFLDCIHMLVIESMSFSDKFAAIWPSCTGASRTFLILLFLASLSVLRMVRNLSHSSLMSFSDLSSATSPRISPIASKMSSLVSKSSLPLDKTPENHCVREIAMR